MKQNKILKLYKENYFFKFIYIFFPFLTGFNKISRRFLWNEMACEKMFDID